MGIEIPYAPIPRYDDERQPVLSNVVTYAYPRGISLNVADAYMDTRFDFSGTRKFDEQNEDRSKSFLTVPMKNHEDRRTATPAPQAADFPVQFGSSRIRQRLRSLSKTKNDASRRETTAAAARIAGVATFDHAGFTIR